jgi:hypothetical protein
LLVAALDVRQRGVQHWNRTGVQAGAIVDARKTKMLTRPLFINSLRYGSISMSKANRTACGLTGYSESKICLHLIGFYPVSTDG